MSGLNEVLEAVDKLWLEEQETLMEMIERRRIIRRRAELAKDIEQARDFQAGACMQRTSKDLMSEILS